MQFYEITHDTTYRYASPVLLSQQIAHLSPRAMPRQRLCGHRLTIAPQPSTRSERLDFFGNPTTRFGLYMPHELLCVQAVSHVGVHARDWPEAARSLPWEAARDHLRDALSGHAPLQADARDAGQYRFASPFVALGAETAIYAAYAARCFRPWRPLLEAVQALSALIHAEFRFDPAATSVATPVAEVFAERHGVCQDFSHMMIACLRALGLAARYVSGYLLTEPPPGQPRLVGADASHAWVAVWCPGMGWVEFDPTNDVQPGLGHITLAWGRDYGDVCPLRGVILGGASHAVDVAVTVMPVEEGRCGDLHAPR
ncbi:transglutaminase family protein [Thauera linaloolentis]|nr:transglutaminase family protein [Thauera linaloolentis]MCM8564613.1 transglutaminase family protein [Thauera linaloolentis]